MIAENYPETLAIAMERAERFDSGYNVRKTGHHSSAAPMDLNALDSDSSSPTPSSSSASSDSSLNAVALAVVNALRGTKFSKSKPSASARADRPASSSSTGPAPIFKAKFPNWSPKVKMTDEMKQFCRDNNLCFYCKGERHSTSDCPVKKAKGGRRN